MAHSPRAPLFHALLPRVPVSILALLSCLFSSPGLRAAPLPDDVMPLSEVRIGMIGEARSVIRGYELTPYKIEIFGIEHGALPGSAMILARMEGEGLENHGIVAGMSGSPVYINGKVIGAVAYGWSFSYHPIAGITPIEHMLGVWDHLDQKPEEPKATFGPGLAASGAAPGNASSCWDWKTDWDRYRSGESDGKALEAITFRPTSPKLAQLAGDAPVTLTPLTSPIFVSGAPSSTFSRIKPFFDSRGLDLIAAGPAAGSGSGSGSGEAPPPMRNGSALGVPLLTGDLTFTSIGTVTYTRGNKLLAFGHPMFSEGRSDAPMSQAYMFGIMQSYSRSFKMGEARDIIGTIRQDRQFGIGGVIGPAPRRVPVSVTVGGKESAIPRTYRYSAWDNRMFLPELAATALDASYSGSVSETGEVTGDCVYTLRLVGGRTIKKTLRASSRSGVGMDFAVGVLQDLFILMNNPFEQAKIDSIDATMDIRPGFRMDSLIRIEPRYKTIKPGDALELDTVWRPFRGPEYQKRLSIKVPKDLDDGYYVAHVADAGSAATIDRRHSPSQFQPMDYAQTVNLVEKLDYPDNRLALYLFEPGMDMSLRTDAFEGLPVSIAGIVSATAADEIQTTNIGRQLAVEHLSFDYPIAARASVMFKVARYLPQ